MVPVYKSYTSFNFTAILPIFHGVLRHPITYSLHTYIHTQNNRKKPVIATALKGDQVQAKNNRLRDT